MYRADEGLGTGLILNDIISAIKNSALVIADITPDNPNVFYEVGFAHALNKPTILLNEKKQCTSQQKLDTNFKYYLSINLISVQYGASFATFLSG